MSGLFFNVFDWLQRSCDKSEQVLSQPKTKSPEGLLLDETGNTPFFHHVADVSLETLPRRIAMVGCITHHFNMLQRNPGEDSASFQCPYIELLRVHQTSTLTMKNVSSFTHGVDRIILSHGNYIVASSRRRCWRRTNATFVKILAHENVYYNQSDLLVPDSLALV